MLTKIWKEMGRTQLTGIGGATATLVAGNAGEGMENYNYAVIAYLPAGCQDFPEVIGRCRTIEEARLLWRQGLAFIREQIGAA